MSFTNVFEILEVVKIADCYPNVSIAYRVLLIMLMTVAFVERNFSKLKLSKNYLRSSISQEKYDRIYILL
jgi:hypothetical protein